MSGFGKAVTTEELDMVEAVPQAGRSPGRTEGQRFWSKWLVLSSSGCSEKRCVGLRDQISYVLAAPVSLRIRSVRERIPPLDDVVHHIPSLEGEIISGACG